MNLTNLQEAKLVRMQAAMKMSELWATYWMAMATTGATTRRSVHKGNHKLTSEELIDDALDVAHTHTNNIERVANNIALLFEGREYEIR